jgi:putative thiamine transport system ATP-binding protein
MTLDVHIRHLGSPARPLLSDLRLRVPAGAILTLMGPSGSGKSSVLAAVAGTLSTQPAGLVGDWTVSLNGHCLDALPTEKRGIGLLFQDDLLFAHMSVADNLLFAVPAGPSAQRHAAVAQALQEAGLAGMGPRDPSTLSGGQRARVALMRALLAQPQALLLDEPFSKLDVALREQFRTFVFEHIRARAIPALLVTHDHADVADPERVVQLSPATGHTHA